MWEIDWYQNEWPWPLFRGGLRSCQPLRHIRHWISRKLLEIKAWFQRTTIGDGLWWGIRWSRDQWRHVTDLKLVTPIRLKSRHLENSLKCYLATIALLSGSMVGYLSDSLASCVFSCVLSTLSINEYATLASLVTFTGNDGYVRRNHYRAAYKIQQNINWIKDEV